MKQVYPSLPRSFTLSALHPSPYSEDISLLISVLDSYRIFFPIGDELSVSFPPSSPPPLLQPPPLYSGDLSLLISLLESQDFLFPVEDETSTSFPPSPPPPLPLLQHPSLYAADMLLLTTPLDSDRTLFFLMCVCVGDFTRVRILPSLPPPPHPPLPCRYRVLPNASLQCSCDS